MSYHVSVSVQHSLQAELGSELPPQAEGCQKPD